METTAIALIALICTNNNLVCREESHSMATYETVAECNAGRDSLSGSVPATGYKIVAKCVPLENRTTGKEWALNWAGEAVGFLERVPIRTAEVEPSDTTTTSDAENVAVRTAGLEVDGSDAQQAERISMTLNTAKSVN